MPLPFVSLIRCTVLFLLFTSLPTWAEVDEETLKAALTKAHQDFSSVTEGANASYIPYLKDVDPNLFGIVAVTADGKILEVGDTKFVFGIESISKVFVLALALSQHGPEAIQEKIGVDATGLPFNSVMAVELETERSVNPFVNAGAIATNSLIQGKSPNEKWDRILGIMNSFAGRDLQVIEELYKSESQTNMHNRGLAMLLKSYDRLYSDPLEATDLYTRQCSVGVTARDLGIMAGTLANLGVNPVTKKSVVKEELVPRILAVMATTGLYDSTGTWLYRTGLPAKSGVGGAIIAVVPGKLGLAVFSPPLDVEGNSVRAQKVLESISRDLHLNLYDAAE